MKTAEEIAGYIDERSSSEYGSEIDFVDILPIIRGFEKEIRADERENRINKLTSIGEFKTEDEAQEYCRLHGLDIHTTRGNLYRIAGALMDARKDEQEKIPVEAIKGALWWLSDGLDNADMDNSEWQKTKKYKDQLETYLNETI